MGGVRDGGVVGVSVCFRCGGVCFFVLLRFVLVLVLVCVIFFGVVGVLVLLVLVLVLLVVGGGVGAVVGVGFDVFSPVLARWQCMQSIRRNPVELLVPHRPSAVFMMMLQYLTWKVSHHRGTVPIGLLF